MKLYDLLTVIPLGESVKVIIKHDDYDEDTGVRDSGSIPTSWDGFNVLAIYKGLCGCLNIIVEVA